jgi:hypothetical protein
VRAAFAFKGSSIAHCLLPGETKCGKSKGMNTQEVANKVVELTRKQAWKEALDTLYAKDIVSVESQGMGGVHPRVAGLRRCTRKPIGG